MTGCLGKKRVLFLDRDGVINSDKGYVHRWEDFEFIPGAIEALRRFSDAGYELVVITNQSGIARGIFGEDEYRSLNAKMLDVLAGQGVLMAGVYHCPHHPQGVVEAFAIKCECRKPLPGLFFRAARDLKIEMAQSIVVGDKLTDLEAGKAAGAGALYLIDPSSARSGIPDWIDDTFATLADCWRRVGQKMLNA